MYSVESNFLHVDGSSEKITYTYTLLQSAGKAPVQVTNYNLTMDIDFQKLRFGGTVRIQMQSEQDAVLNSVGLSIESIVLNGKNIHFRQRDEDLIVETGALSGVLEVNYTGIIPDSLIGIYRAPYDHTHIVTTHFEACASETNATLRR